MASDQAARASEANAYRAVVANITRPGLADTKLTRRAEAVMPSLTHLDVSTHIAPGYSQFFTSGRGATTTSTDGRVWIDYMCSYGPVLLGHQNSEVDAAVQKQLTEGDCLPGPSERMVECAEMLVRITPWAQWALFAKNGSDATALAVRLARSATGKRVILRAPHAYHGAAALWAEGLPRRLHKQGVLEEDVKYLAPFQYNDLASVQAAMDAVSDDVAGVMVSAFMWDYATPHELPTAEFLQGVRKLCDERGAILICDDVRSSFRVHPAGTWADPRFGHGVDPDLTCLCKGIANGHPLSAILGRNGQEHALRRAVKRLRATGSFWANAVPFVAALATIPQAADAAARAVACGVRLREGMLRQAAAHGLGDDFACSGPPQMPYWYFRSERDRELAERYRILIFCATCTEGHVWIHPFHTNFLGGAHSVADIDSTLQVTEKGFARVAAFLQTISAKL